MAAGVVAVEIVHEMDLASVSGALATLIASTDATARFSAIPINQGQGAIIFGVSQA